MHADTDSARAEIVVRLPGQLVHGCRWLPELKVPGLHAAAVESLSMPHPGWVMQALVFLVSVLAVITASQGSACRQQPQDLVRWWAACTPCAHVLDHAQQQQPAFLKRPNALAAVLAQPAHAGCVR